MNDVAVPLATLAHSPAPRDLRIVGIAASAGGLEALRELIGALPETGGLSYVVAQHLSPSHTSTLVDLLSRRTALRVVGLLDGQVPAAGTIYVTPPNHEAVFVDGRFELVDSPVSPQRREAADNLFRSMAQALGEKAIGIVLSGAGSDGTAGLCDIKAASGVTIAQDPASSLHDGMPKSAIRSGCVDLVLQPAEMGPVLLRLANEDVDADHAVALDDDGDLFEQVAQLVRVRTAFRLDAYKAGTVRRRIARRLGLLNLPGLAEYARYMHSTPDEA